jgi:hypothetical protein
MVKLVLYHFHQKTSFTELSFSVPSKSTDATGHLFMSQFISAAPRGRSYPGLGFFDKYGAKHGRTMD